METFINQLLSQTLSLSPSTSHVLNSNEVPSHSQALQLQQQLHQANADIGHLGRALQILQIRYLQYQALLLRFPPEVLKKIFLHVVSVSESGRDTNADGRSEVVNLMLVCRSWRDTALLTRGLWEHISLSSDYSDTAYQKVTRWFSRSGDLPNSLHWDQGHDTGNIALLIKLLKEGPALGHLSVNIASSGPDFFRQLTEANQAMPQAATDRTLEPTRQRTWDTITSMRVFFAYPLLFAKMKRSDREELRRMFRNFPQSLTHLVMHLSGPAVYVPNLKVDLQRFRPELRNGLLSVPSSNLRYLFIKCDWKGTHVLDLLEQCPRLEMLQADFNGASPLHHRFRNGILARERTSLLHLQSLCLSHVGTLDQLRYLRAPNLRELDLTLSGDDWKFAFYRGSGAEHNVSILFNFLEASGKLSDTLHDNYVPLEYLRLANTPSSTPTWDLHHLLTSPDLQVEHMTLDHISGIPWDHLAYPDPDPSDPSEYVHAEGPQLPDRPGRARNRALKCFELLNVPAAELFPCEEVFQFLKTRGGDQIQIHGSSEVIEDTEEADKYTPLDWEPLVGEDSAFSVRITPFRLPLACYSSDSDSD